MAGADIVCTVTNARAPVLEGAASERGDEPLAAFPEEDRAGWAAYAARAATSGDRLVAEHLADAVDPARGGAEAALAASVFHFGEFSVLDAKKAIGSRGLTVRMPRS